MAGLAPKFTVVAADYEGHRLAHPAPDTLTPANLARDLLAIADAAGVDRFAYYGYSWMAMVGLQLALRTERLTALVMGGFPPLGGPYDEMLRVARAARAMADDPVAGKGPDVTPGDWEHVRVQNDVGQTQQFVTLYEALANFDDRDSLELDVPRLCFAGAEDQIDYGAAWGGVRVAMAGPLRDRRAELEAQGWTVRLLPGLDHSTAMHGRVALKVLRVALKCWLLPRAG
jgi:pimeloyl-ACP methyl ester carboxylesterase